MALSLVDLYNKALSATASKARVSSQNETSREANLCNLWYTQVRRTVLKSASWPCAITHSRLALVKERTEALWQETDPAPGFRYQYAEPSNCLAPRHLFSFERFTRGTIEGTKTINANQPQAILTYIRDEPDLSLWDVGLENAVINTLAAYISLDLTGKTFIYDRLMRVAMDTVKEYQTEVANEMDEQFEDVPSWIKARGYEGNAPITRFFYPYESLSGIVP